MTNNNIKEALERITFVAYMMGKDNVDKYEFSYKMDKMIADVVAELSTNVSKDVNAADIMERIAADPDRFIKGVCIKDRYPDVRLDSDAFTIIRKCNKDNYSENVFAVWIDPKTLKGYYMTGVKSKSSSYIGSKNYAEVEIPTWVRQ